ncbi:MAG: GGDEF domain-containing protein, partial [Chlamydiales bacterium]
RVVERLRHSIRSASVPAAGDDRSVAVAGSLGFEVFPGPQLSSVEGLRGHAELALRAAKRGGGDRGVCYRLLR